MVIFGAGVITGGFSVARFSARNGTHPLPAQAHRPPTFAVPNVGGVRVEFLRKLQRELDLSAEQRREVDRILAQSQDRTRKLMEPIAPQLRQEVQSARERFRAILTAPQKERFDAMLKQQQRGRDPKRDRSEKSERGAPK